MTSSGVVRLYPSTPNSEKTMNETPFILALQSGNMYPSPAYWDKPMEGSLGLSDYKPKPGKSQPGALRIADVISNKTQHLFDYMTKEDAAEHGIAGPSYYTKLKNGDYLRPTLLFEQWYYACFRVGLFTITPSNIADWMLRLRLLVALDDHPFVSEENVPYIPTIRELSRFFGLEVLGHVPLTNEEFIENTVRELNREIAHAMQCAIDDTLPSDSYLPYAKES